MPKLNDTEREERIDHVLAGARRCFAQYGYEGATVRRLEQETGFSRGAIFNWFPSKEELFVELARRDNQRLLTLFAEHGFAPLVHALVEEDADWLAVYLEFGRRMRADAAFRERWKERAGPDLRRRVDERLEEQRAAGLIRSDVDQQAISRFLGVVLDGILAQRALGFDPPDPETIVTLVEDAIRAPAPARRRTSGDTRAPA